jgi:hypothetical protein
MHKYQDGNNAMQLVDAETGEPYMTATATLGTNLKDKYVLIKNYSENSGILEALIEQGVIKDTGVMFPTGYVELHLCELLIK